MEISADRPFRGAAGLVSWVAVLMVGLLDLGRGQAQGLLNQVPSVHSSSGQFIASAKPGRPLSSALLAASTDAGLLRLDPNTLAVSAERIKEKLYRELEMTGPGRGKIYLMIRPARGTNDSVLIASERLRDGWQYGVELPEVIDRFRFVRALTQCVLLEYANRHAPARSAEIPLWLSEGLATYLLSSSEAEIVLSAPQFSRDGGTVAARFLNVQRENPLIRLRQQFAEEAPLTFQELSWPESEQLAGPRAVQYRASAMLFICEVLRLRDGRAGLRNFLVHLPQFYNWQFAFLQAFRTSFERPIHIEKWWDLQAAHFTGRALGETWSSTESWYKLDELLGAPVQVRVSTNDLPRHARITLQGVIQDWKRADQAPVLQERVLQLTWLRLRIAPDLAALVDDYRVVLANYLDKRVRIDAEGNARNPSAQRRYARDAIDQLDRLDVQRQAVRPKPR
jgi:hypothetical protein